MAYDFDKINEQVYSRTTVNNLVGKFWAKFCQSHGDLPMKMFSDDGDLNYYWLSVSDIISGTDGDLNESNLINYLLQPQFDDFVPGLPDDAIEYPQAALAKGFGDEFLISISLGSLLDVFGNDDEYKLRQFNVISSRVVSLLDKIVKNHRLYEPIELAYINCPDAPVFLSGRHRATALLSLFSRIEGWEDLQVYVKLHAYSSCSSVASHIETRNGSRSMTSQEKTNLWFATEGYNVSDTTSIFDACEKGISVLPKVMNAYFVSSLETDKDELGITEATCGQLGQKIATKLKTALPANLRRFLKDAQSAQAIADTCLDTVLTNWNDLKTLCQLKQLDSEGNQVVTCNVSRNLDKIANPVAIEVAQAFKSSLESRLNEIEATKEKQKMEKAAKSKKSKQRKLLESIELLKSEGLISEDQLQQFVVPEAVAV